jgi:hypothetical protein
MSGEKEIQIRRMMQQFEHQISEMNSASVREIAGDIRKTDFLDLAKSISVLRARYLKEILQMAHADDTDLTNSLCFEVRQTREAYEEAVESFEQLKHALQRGYFHLLEE